MVLLLQVIVSGSKTNFCNTVFSALLWSCLKARDGFVSGGVLGVEVRVARSGAAVENWVLEPSTRSGYTM